MSSNDLANVGWGKSPRTPKAIQTENKKMEGENVSATEVKEFPEDTYNSEEDGIDIDYENVEIDCDPAAMMTDCSDDESSETRISGISNIPTSSPLNSPGRPSAAPNPLWEVWLRGPKRRTQHAASTIPVSAARGYLPLLRFQV